MRNTRWVGVASAAALSTALSTTLSVGLMMPASAGTAATSAATTATTASAATGRSALTAKKASKNKKATNAKKTNKQKKKASKKKRPIREYVALGDSWSADTMFIDVNGLPDATHAPLDCFQSPVNYPKLLAKELGVKRFRDATCGSATTVHFTQPQKVPLGGVNPPQFDRLTKRTDLVTMGIGGNDARIAAAAFDCLSVLPFNLPGIEALPTLPKLPIPLLGQKLPLGACKAYYTKGGVDQLRQNIKNSKPKLVKAVRQIKKKSPKARILVVNYLAAIPTKTCWPLLPMTQEDVTYLHNSFKRLNKMLASVARKTKVELVDTFTPTLGHDVCAPPGKRYAEVLGLSINDLGVVVPAHPNAAGARAQFRATLKQVKKGGR